ncbi:hypothetical protein NMY22_g10833 [Coprinellus aureogranulatus]|nr:hypothetical protein NMY22_g10833 [Coprinellus aureogranulatus]
MLLPQPRPFAELDARLPFQSSCYGSHVTPPIPELKHKTLQPILRMPPSLPHALLSVYELRRISVFFDKFAQPECRQHAASSLRTEGLVMLVCQPDFLRDVTKLVW